MTLQSSGAISFNNINTAAGTTATWQLSCNDERFRNLAGGSAYSSQVSLSSSYSQALNGFYYYPRQTSSMSIVVQQASRQNNRVDIYVGTDGSFGINCFTSGATVISKTTPDRFYTPLTTNIANNYQVNFFQTGWSNSSGVGSWNWSRDSQGWSTGAGVGATSATGWAAANISFTSNAFYLTQAQVSPGAAYDITATGTFQIRLTATPTTIISIPFSIRVFAL